MQRQTKTSLPGKRTRGKLPKNVLNFGVHHRASRTGTIHNIRPQHVFPHSCRSVRRAFVKRAMLPRVPKQKSRAGARVDASLNSQGSGCPQRRLAFWEKRCLPAFEAVVQVKDDREVRPFRRRTPECAIKVRSELLVCFVTIKSKSLIKAAGFHNGPSQIRRQGELSWDVCFYAQPQRQQFVEVRLAHHSQIIPNIGHHSCFVFTCRYWRHGVLQRLS